MPNNVGDLWAWRMTYIDLDDDPTLGEPAKHHPLLGCTLLSATAGAKQTPSIERFHTALALDPIPVNEQWVVEVWLANATTRDLIRVWLDGGYSLRTLARAMHALHGAHGNGRDRTETINRFALAPEAPRRS